MGAFIVGGARQRASRLHILGAVSAVLCLGALSVPATADASSGAPAVHVAGNRLTDATSAPLQLHGVNRSGTEYACVQGWGIFDGPSDAASVAAMASWKINAVRVPLNEDCWLGINGVSSAYGGAVYQQAIENYVALLNSAGAVAILDLHWAAPGGVAATGQLPMPDADHSPAFWAGVAAAFKNDPAVMFDLFNEPYVGTSNAVTSDPWDCWRNGCLIHAGGGVSQAWQAAGMQSLVDAVRGAGATQPVMAGGLAWSNDLTGWLAHAPNDPLHQLVASLHMYNFNACASQSCWMAQVAPMAASVPVVTGELGENDCAGGFVNSYMSWADSFGISYLGWTWDTWDCRNGPALISDYSGTPTAFGQAVRDHLAALASQPVITQPDPVTSLTPSSAGATVSAAGVTPSSGTGYATHRARAHASGTSTRRAAPNPWMRVR